MQARILKTSAAAAYCGLSQSSLERMRGHDSGPAFVRLGPSRVGYDLKDLDEWIARRKADGASGDVSGDDDAR